MKKRRKDSVQTPAYSRWPGINHMLESWVESVLGEAWELRLEEEYLPGCKIGMLTLMKGSVSECRAPETTAHLSVWSM